MDFRILYVEDDPMIRDNMARFLERRYKSVLYAVNGQEGLDKFKENRIDLVITDIQMPVMTGLEMAKEIRLLDADVPIIATTAFSESQYLLQAMEIGIDNYLLKPIDKKQLLSQLEKYTQLQRQKAEVAEKDEMIAYLFSLEPCLALLVKEGRTIQANRMLLDYLGHATNETLLNASPTLDKLPVSADFQEAWFEALQNAAEITLRLKESTMRARLEHFPVSQTEIITFSQQ